MSMDWLNVGNILTGKPHVSRGKSMVSDVDFPGNQSIEIDHAGHFGVAQNGLSRMVDNGKSHIISMDDFGVAPF